MFDIPTDQRHWNCRCHRVNYLSDPMLKWAIHEVNPRQAVKPGPGLAPFAAVFPFQYGGIRLGIPARTTDRAVLVERLFSRQYSVAASDSIENPALWDFSASANLQSMN